MKKALGMILVLVMLVSMVPALEVAAAEETTWTKVNSLADIGANDTFAITITDGDNTYVLPVVAATNATTSRDLPELKGSVNGDTLTVAQTHDSVDYAFGWKIIVSENNDGYYIKDAADGSKYYLGTNYHASGNGVLIYSKSSLPTTDARFLLNVLNCGLLGAINKQTNGTNYSALCIVDGQWKSVQLADATSATKPTGAENNVLGLWKLGTGCNCEDVNPKDHNCDICGAPLSECQDAAGDGDHNCDICNKEGVTDHKWQDATIEAPKTCTECGETEGEKLPLSPTPENSHWVKVEDLSEIAEGEKLAIAITIDGVTYLLPNAKVTNSVSAPTTEHKATISEDGRFLTVGSGRHNYNWTVVPAEGGYHIMSGGMYLWVDNGNAGVRISTDTPAVWKIFSGSKLLGSQDPSGNLRTLCIREGIWQSFKVSSETAQAHSTVRNNTLSLWKYVSGPDDAASQTGDSTVSVMFATLVISAMSVVALVSKKKF